MKKCLLIVLMFSIYLTGVSQANPSKIELNTGWKFKQVRGVNWYPAVIPGVVHLDLINNKIIEDPYFRLNERACQWVDKEDWEYRTVFDISDEMFAKDSIRLAFKGLDTYADVYLNEEKILSANNMFREWNLNCKGKLKKQGNILRIYFHSPIKIDLPKFEASTYHYVALNDQSENGGLFNKKVSVYARKAGYHYGWDWGPRLVTSGVWRPVYIEAWNNTRIEDVQVFQDNVTAKSATLRAVVEINSTKEQTAKISLLNAENNQAYTIITANLKSGINKIEVPFVIKNPHLWWPNGLGSQYRYPLKTTVSVSDIETDSKEIKTGIRSIKLVLQNPDGEKSFHFEVNGVPVFMKGANYIPLDNFVPRISNEKYEKTISDAKKSNINMLRVWGGGIYENDIFYDLCDKYGILVWQDFMFAASLYPADEEMLENIRQEAIQNVKRIRNHACIALWCGNNEMNQGWTEWGWDKDAEKVSKETAEKVGTQYKNIFHKILPEVVKEFDPGTAYWKSSPIVENGSGDMHYWEVWHAEAPITEYAKVIPQFMSEYGFQSFPEFGSVKLYAPEQRDWDIYSEVMLLHQRNKRGNQLINSYLNMDYRKPKDFRSFLYLSHILQADAVKIAEEAHRRNMPKCMGSLYWQLNDCWPVASWSSTDYYGRWKALQYYTKRAFSEVLVSPFEENGKLNVYVVSDRLSNINANLLLKIFDLDGNVVFSESKPVKIKANTSSLSFSEPVEMVLKGKARNEVVVYAEVIEKDKRLSTNSYYLAKTKDIDFRLVTFDKEIKPAEGGFEITLKTEKPAKGVYLELGDINNFFSDNYFDLMPGQSFHIKVETKLPQNEFEKQLKISCIRDSY